jgi:uncharacterized membrane protein YedE/YeeE
MRSLAYLLPGALFGAGLAIAGMTNPARVIGFLDVAGTWDPTLAFVMSGAVATFALGRKLVLRRACPLLGGRFPGPPPRAVDPRLLAGAALFGVGWGLSGFCPGPAVTNLGALRTEALVFVPAMLAGMLVAQRAFGADR